VIAKFFVFICHGIHQFSGANSLICLRVSFFHWLPSIRNNSGFSIQHVDAPRNQPLDQGIVNTEASDLTTLRSSSPIIFAGVESTKMNRALRSASLLSKVSTKSSRVIPSENKRALSYVLDGWGSGGGGSSQWQWPVAKANTVFNIVPQGHKYIVERFGKLHSIQDSGWFLAIPMVDQISYVIDIRERAIDIPPQSAITRDNVSVEVSGNLFIKFQDAEAAAYGALNPLYSVTQVGIIFARAS
jgi:hypothetical protein